MNQQEAMTKHGFGISLQRYFALSPNHEIQEIPFEQWLNDGERNEKWLKVTLEPTPDGDWQVLYRHPFYGNMWREYQMSKVKLLLND